VSAVELPCLRLRGAGGAHRSVASNENECGSGGLRRQARYLRPARRGASMIEGQIRDGDFVVTRIAKTAENGEMVIALHARIPTFTLKKFL